MNKRFCVSLTCAKNDTDKATVGFVIANAARPSSAAPSWSSSSPTARPA
jgi:hypothetical protein